MHTHFFFPTCIICRTAVKFKSGSLFHNAMLLALSLRDFFFLLHFISLVYPINFSLRVNEFFYLLSFPQLFLRTANQFNYLTLATRENIHPRLKSTFILKMQRDPKKFNYNKKTLIVLSIRNANSLCLSLIGSCSLCKNIKNTFSEVVMHSYSFFATFNFVFVCKKLFFHSKSLKIFTYMK